jgi:predicted PurR-regulated permease PerM
MQPTVIALPPRRTIVPWLVAAVIVGLMVVFRQALTLAFVGFATAYVLAPSVQRVQRYGVPRPLAILLVLMTGTTLVGTVVSVLVPELIRQTESLMRSVPDWSSAIQHRWIPWLRQHWHLHIPASTEDAFAQLGLRASSIAPRIGSLLNDTLTYTLVVLEYIVTGLLVFAVAFYMLLEIDQIVHNGFELVPHRARARVAAIAREVDETLRHFIHGQLLVMAVLGVLFAVGLGALGVPAGWAIGLLAGMISFVPYLGFFVALGLALLMTALAGHGVAQLVAVTGVMSAVHILDLTVITPRILGGRAKLSPVVTMLALVAGGSVFGFVGFLVAIPVASVLRVLLRELVSHYKSTPFFTTGLGGGALQSVPFTHTPSALESDLRGALAMPAVSPAVASTPPAHAEGAAADTPPRPTEPLP